MKQTKDVKISFKCTNEEHEKIKAKAETLNTSINRLAKFLLLKVNPKITINY